MKRNALIVLLSLNICYLVIFLFNELNDLLLNGFWVFLFIVSIIIALFFLLRFKRESIYNIYWSIAVLAVSIGSLSTFGFTYYIEHLMG